MARGEDADLTGLNIPEPEKLETVFLGLRGKDSEEEMSFAKCVKSYRSGDDVSSQWFIRMGRGEIIDPYEIDYGLSKKKLSALKFKKVSKEAFDNYKKYLECKNRLYFTRARRLVMEY
mgnify:CR=1 FL=1|tara:strand:- start:96 stop:449 length:354 start_codon:yes stop_codon:yes gene_type:complete